MDELILIKIIEDDKGKNENNYNLNEDAGKNYISNIYLINFK